MSCVFCNIVAGREPAHVVLETDAALCILPREMELFGHTLVLPKVRCQSLFDAPHDALVAVVDATQLLAIRMRAIGATGVNVLHASGVSAQQSVPHFHAHVLPRHDGDGADAWPQLPGTSATPEEVLRALGI